MKNLALALTVLLLAAVAYLLIGGEADDGVVSLEERAEEVVGRSPAELGGAPAEVAVSEGGERVHVDVAGAAGAEEARDVTALTGPTRELLVVDGATGAPVAGAAVHQFDVAGERFDGPRGFVAAVVEQGMGVLDEHLEAATFGRTDADGRVRVRDELFGTAVLVQAGGKRGFGLLSLGRDTGDVVRLVEPQAVVLEVIDEAGRPRPGVTLLTKAPELRFIWREGVTDPAGQWVWHEANSLLLPVMRAALDAEPGVSRVATYCAQAREVTFEVDLAQPERIVRTLPGVTVEVWLVDADSQPWATGEVFVQLGHPGGVSRIAAGEDGCARFPGVPVGSAVGVILRTTSATGRQVLLEEGPLDVPAEGLEIRMGPPPTEPREWIARLVDPGGEPLGDARVLGRTSVEGDGVLDWNEFEARTDADGELALQLLTHASVLGDGEFWAVDLLVEGHDTVYGIEEQVVFGPSAPPWDSGELVCHPAELLVAGTVQDAAGRPVAEARIQVAQLVDGRQRRPNDFSQEVWFDGHGGFAIYADGRGTDWMLSATTQWEGERQGVVFAPGTRDLEVVLEKPGALVVSVASDQLDWLPGLTLRGRQPGVAAEEQPAIAMAMQVDEEGWATGFFMPNGVLTWSAVQPGPIELELVHQEQPLAALGTFVIESGRILRDPSLQGLRLEAWLTAVPVTVTNTAGEPIEGVTVAEPRGVLAWPPGGRPLAADGVIVGELPAERIFLADGYSSQKVRLNGAPLTVVLEAEATVWLRLPAEAQASEHVRVALVNPAMGTGEVRESSWRAVDAPAVEVPVEAWGTQRVYLEWKVDHGDFFSRAMGPVPGQTFELQRGDAGRAFDVALPEEILDDLR